MATVELNVGPPMQHDSASKQLRNQHDGLNGSVSGDSHAAPATQDGAASTALQQGAFQPFLLEEWQSRWEHHVECNLADSGVQAVTLEELVSGPEALQALLRTSLGYPPVEGTPELRALVAGWHGAAPDDVLVTVGCSEANQLIIAALVQPGDHVVVMEPAYRQVWGCALNAGAKIDSFGLKPEAGWRPDLEALERLAAPGTKLIAITNPNNPVGTVLTTQEMEQIVAIAKRCDAWLLVDEVYRGAEHRDEVPPSLWAERGGYDKVVCTGGLSKSFGLSGLRCGWLVAPPELLQAAWRRHEYYVIATSTLTMKLAEVALRQQDALLARCKAKARHGYEMVRKWVDGSGGLLSLHPVEATALAFVRYHADVPSEELGNILRTEASVLVAPGVYFGIEHHFRMTFGMDPSKLAKALPRITEVLQRYPRT